MMRRFMHHLALLSLVAVYLTGCQDSKLPTGAEPGPPAMVLSDGRDALQGNPDFFWFPPMLPNPSGEPNFDAGQFDSGLLSQSRVRICAPTGVDVDGNPVFNPDGTCAGPPVAEFTSTMDFGGEFLVLVAEGELYQADWHTDLSSLNDGVTYRIFALVRDVVVGFADLDVVNSGKDLKSVATGEFVALKDGRTLPIKFRLEAGIRCFLLGSTTCTAQTVDLADGGIVFLDVSEGDGTTAAGLDLPPGGGTGDAVFVLQSCAAAGGPPDLPIDIPTFGPCLDVTAFRANGDPLTELVVPTTVFACIETGYLNVGDDITTAVQEELIRIHRLDETPEPVVAALPLVEDPCALLVAADLGSNPFMRFARAVGDHLMDFLAPKPLYAKKRRFLHRLSGGLTPNFSRFQFALPAKMEKVAGVGQQAFVGVPVEPPPAVAVTDALGFPVKGATVHFAADENSPVVPTEMTTGGDGIAAVQWTLNAVGTRTLTARGWGIAVEGNDGPQVDFFDPFTPIPGPSPGDRDEDGEVELGTGELVFTALAEAFDPPDLVVSSIDLTSTEVSPGQDVSYTYTISNIGGQAPEYSDPSRWDVATYLSINNLLDGNDLELIWGYSAWTYPLSVGWSHSLPDQALIPIGVAPGDYYLIVVVDVRPGQPPNNYPGVDESDESNNWLASASTFTVLPVPQ